MMKKIFNVLFIGALWLGHAMAHAGTVTYVYTDPQGTPLAEADATGTITARFDYAPYGATVSSLGASPNGPGYTGHVNDPESGFLYMQARYYDPYVGRFLSLDPSTPVAGGLYNFNRFNYANNNPMNNVDLNGKAPQSFSNPLFMLNWFNKESENAVKDNYIEPAKLAYRKTDENVTLSTSAGFAYKKFGAIVEINLLHPSSFSIKPVYGLGAVFSVDIATKQPWIEANIFGHDGTEESPFKVVTDLEYGEVLHGGLTSSLDYNGNVSVNGKAGLGFGALGSIRVKGIDVSVGPAAEHNTQKHPDDSFVGDQ